MADKTPKLNYSKRQLEKLVLDIHRGKITPQELPEGLYEAIKQYLINGLEEGFGANLDTVSEADRALFEDLYENIELFSAAKTFSFIKSSTELLVDDNGAIKPFNEFRDEWMDLNGKYNEDWLRAEYNTTISSSQAAQQWQTIEQNKDVLPMLTYSTSGTPCDECEPFEGLTAPVDDPIWDEATPPLHFNCMCLIQSSDTSKAWDQSKIDALPTDKIPEMFRNNPGKTGEIFNSAHPYMNIDEGDAKFAQENFGLPLDDLNETEE